MPQLVSRVTDLVAVVGALLVVQALPARAAAPPQLYNKTIQIGWTSSVSEHDDAGQHKNIQLSSSHIIYVSTAGRLFERSRRSVGKNAKQSENAPDATHNRGGEARGLRFQGNKLVGTIAWAQGAINYVVNFDGGFSSCTVDVMFGRDAGGGLQRRGVNGVMYHIDSEAASGQHCSISEGNALAGE
jgi:hypothetical protein